MSYRVTTTKAYGRKFRKLDFIAQRTIMQWIKKNLSSCDNPRQHGKALTGDFKGLWRYRVGDYRLIADIRDEELIIIALDIGPRRECCR